MYKEFLSTIHLLLFDVHVKYTYNKNSCNRINTFPSKPSMYLIVISNNISKAFRYYRLLTLIYSLSHMLFYFLQDAAHLNCMHIKNYEKQTRTKQLFSPLDDIIYVLPEHGLD